jgi:ribonuclease P protein component
MKLFKFSKKERICKRNDFQLLSSQATSFYSYPFRCLYLVRPANSFIVKVGISVPKKNFKLAIRRNRIKRMIRETYRLNKTTLYTTFENHAMELLIFLIYTEKKEIPYDILYKQFNLLLNKLIHINLRNELKNTILSIIDIFFMLYLQTQNKFKIIL